MHLLCIYVQIHLGKIFFKLNPSSGVGKRSSIYLMQNQENEALI